MSFYPNAISIPQAAARYGVSSKVVRRWILCQGFPAARRTGKISRYYIDPAQLEAWLAIRPWMFPRRARLTSKESL